VTAVEAVRTDALQSELEALLRCIQRDLGCTFPSEGGGVVGSALIDCTSDGSSVRHADESVDEEELWLRLRQ